MDAVAIIPAKGLSTRLPGKNIRPFHGKPMLVHSIETALASGLFDEVYVSTDHEETARIAQAHGAQSLHRQAELTADHFGPLDVAAKALFDFAYQQDYHPRFCCVIYATAPLMTVADLIDGRQSLGEFHRYAMAVNADPDQPLQDAAMFVWCQSHALIRGDALYKQHTALVPVHPSRVCDINTAEDWARAERMYAELHGVAA